MIEIRWIPSAVCCYHVSKGIRPTIAGKARRETVLQTFCEHTTPGKSGPLDQGGQEQFSTTASSRCQRCQNWAENATTTHRFSGMGWSCKNCLPSKEQNSVGCIQIYQDSRSAGKELSRSLFSERNPSWQGFWYERVDTKGVVRNWIRKEASTFTWCGRFSFASSHIQRERNSLCLMIL